MFKKIERQLEKAVEGSFGRAFKGSVQPVELAHKLAKEMGDHKSVSVSRVYVPNVYEVYLSPADYGHFKSFEGAITRELGTYLAAHAQREGWTLVAAPVIELYADDELQLGEFGIATRNEAEAPQPVGAPEEPGMMPIGPPPVPVPPVVAPPVVAPPVIAPVVPPAGFAHTIVAPPPTPAEAPIARRTELCGVLTVGGEEHVLSTGSAMIGRSRRCDIVLADPNTSRQHAEVRREGDAYVIIDLDSTNGVLVNRRAVKRAVLQDGDRIELGATELRFERRPC